MAVGRAKKIKKVRKKKVSVSKMGPLPATAVVKCKNPPLKRGTVGTYGDLMKKTGDGTSDREHVPSYKALEKRAQELNNHVPLDRAQKRRVKNAGKAIVLPKSEHKQGRTYGGKNTAAQSNLDSQDLAAAAGKDIQAYKDLGLDWMICMRLQSMPMTNQEYDAMLLSCLSG